MFIYFQFYFNYYLITINTILEYESNNIGTLPANAILNHMSWFINTLEKSVNDRNSLMEVSILCMFK